MADAEGPSWAVRHRPEDLALADRGAEAAGLPAPRRFRIGGYTDAALARIAGLPDVSLLSLRGNVFNDYHLPSDTPENVDWESVDRCLRLAEGTIRAWRVIRRGSGSVVALGATGRPPRRAVRPAHG